MGAQAILKLSSVQKNGQVSQINLLSRYDNSLTENTPKYLGCFKKYPYWFGRRTHKRAASEAGDFWGVVSRESAQELKSVSLSHFPSENGQ